MSDEAKPDFPIDRAVDRVADSFEHLAFCLHAGKFEAVRDAKRRLADDLEEAIQENTNPPKEPTK